MDSLKLKSASNMEEERKPYLRNDLLQWLEQKEDAYIILLVEKATIIMETRKLILAMRRSPLFATVCFKAKHNNVDFVKVDGLTVRVLNLILDYISDDELKTDSPEELMEVAKAAGKFEIGGLIRSCKHNLISCSIDIHNIWSVKKASKYFKLEALGERCPRFLNSLSTEAELDMPKFFEISQDTLFNFLKNRYTFIESDAFWMENIIRWIQHHKSRNRTLLSAIQTFSLNYDEFLDIIEKYPTFFTSKEIARVLCNMLRPGMLELPPWCETKSETDRKQPLADFNDVVTNTLNIQLKLNRKFPNSFFYEEDGFEGTVVFEIRLTKHFPQTPYLLMLELAFGSAFVPKENLKLELYRYDQQNLLVKKKINFSLGMTKDHYYLRVNDEMRLQKNHPFVFSVKVSASGLKTWSNGGPISNRQYRVAKIPEDIFQNICLDVGVLKSVCLTVLSDWIIFVDPKRVEKNLVLTGFYFDSSIKNEELSSHT